MEQDGAGQPQPPASQGSAAVDATTAAGASQGQPQRSQIQQLLAQPLQQSSLQPGYVVTAQTTVQKQQSAQQNQQPTATNQELGIWPQQVQQQQRVQFSPRQQVQPLQQQNPPPYQQPAPASAPDLGVFAQHLPATTPIAIPVSAVLQPQKLLRGQPAGASPSSLNSSQHSAVAQHGSTVSSGGLTRAGSARPDALSQLQLQQQPTESPSRFMASTVQNSFKQREAVSAAAVATGGVDLSGSTAPLSLLGAVQNPQRFSAGGMSNKSLSPRTSHFTGGGTAITPQTSVQLTQLSRATSLALHVAGGSKLRQQGRRATVDSDDTDYSSSDNDDNYEYGEARIKRTFTRQQRRHRKQQRDEQQLQQQQVHAAVQLQRQMSHAVQQMPSDQATAALLSPHSIRGASEDGSVVSAAGTAVSHASSAQAVGQPLAAAVGAAAAAATVPLGTSPQGPGSAAAQVHLLPTLQQQQNLVTTGLQNVTGVIGSAAQGTPPQLKGQVRRLSSSTVGGSPAGGSPAALPAVSAAAAPPPTPSLLTAAFEGMQAAGTAIQQQQQQLQQQAVMIRTSAVSTEEAGMQSQAAVGGGDSRHSSMPGVPAPSSARAGQDDNGGEVSFKESLHHGLDGQSGGGGGVDSSKDMQTSPSELQAEFQGLSLFDDADDDEDADVADKELRPWYKRPLVWGYIVGFTLSAGLLIVGAGSEYKYHKLTPVNSIQLFRWMYFFSLGPVLWVTVHYATNKLFAFVEWMYYLEALYALDSVRRNAWSLVFSCLLLPWFYACFWVIGCNQAAPCTDEQPFRKASDTVWKILVCLTLFSLANFLKSLTTKLLSTHFYRTAHFKKVKLAIEKEYYLLMLSQQRPARQLSDPPAPHNVLTQFVSIAGDTAGSVANGIASGSLQAVDRIRRMTLERGDSPSAFLAAEDDQRLTDIKGKARASSFSGAELDPSFRKLPNLTSKSVNFFESYRHSERQTRDITATAAGPRLGTDEGPFQSRLWGMRSTRSQPWLQVPRASSEDTINGQVSPVLPDWQQQQATAVPTAGAQLQLHQQQLPPPPQQQQQQQQQQPPPQQQQLGLSPVRESVVAAHIQLTEKSVKDVEQLLPQQEIEEGSAGQKSSKPGAGRRWAWWRKTNSQKELLLGTHAARSSEYAIAIAASPPTTTDINLDNQQKDSLNTASQMADGTTPAALGPQAGSAFAAAATTAAPDPSPKNSTDLQRPLAGRVGSMTSRQASQPLANSASMAAPRGDAVADQLLQTLEKVNVLGGNGKQVDAATIKPAEWERLRTGIALKTFTALMKRYQDMTDAEEAKKLREARRFAKGLFYNVKGDASRPFLVRDDFAPFFPSKDQADQAFAYFDKDNDAQLTIKEMKDSVTAIFKERKNMAASLKDTDSIVKTLEFGIGFLLHFIFAAVYLLVWGLDIVKGFSTFSATVLALTFVFGNSVRQIYESMLFLFVEHAFDVGDLLEVEALSYRVKKIDLMYTVLVKGTGERVYYPTTRLITLPVTNLTRSSTKSDKVMFNLDIGEASMKAREALLDRVKSHYEENESDFNSCPSVNFISLMDPFKVQLQVVWTYNFGADEFKRISTARTGIITAINDCLASLNCLQYTLVKSTDSSSSKAGAADHVQNMLETGQMQMIATGVPAAPGMALPGSAAAAVVGVGGALGLLSVQ